MSSSEDDLEFRHEARFNSMRSPIMTKEGKKQGNNILKTQYPTDSHCLYRFLDGKKN